MLGLLLGVGRYVFAASGDRLVGELSGLHKPLVGLAEISDRDALAGIEDEGLGTGIPTLGLVAEVDARVEQVLGSDVQVHYDLMFLTRHRPAGGPPCDRWLWVVGLVPGMGAGQNTVGGGHWQARIGENARMPLTRPRVLRIVRPLLLQGATAR